MIDQIAKFLNFILNFPYGNFMELKFILIMWHKFLKKISAMIFDFGSAELIWLIFFIRKFPYDAANFLELVIILLSFL